MFYYFDYYYLVLVIPAVIIAILAQVNVSRTFNKYKKVKSNGNKTGAMVAREILDYNGLSHVRIEHVSGNLSDHFDPKSNCVRLSDSVYGSTSVASIGVAAHEVGHAIQYAKSYGPMKFRAAIIPITNIGSTLAIPIAMIGIFLNYGWLINIGILLYSAVALFQLITLPVEFNASKRARETLTRQNILTPNEVKGARSVLNAAALTYVAALITTLASLLRIILLSRRNR